MNGSVCVVRWLLAGVTYLCYTVLTSSNKSETAVHNWDPALSVFVMLVSRNVFPVVIRFCCFFFCPTDRPTGGDEKRNVLLGWPKAYSEPHQKLKTLRSLKQLLAVRLLINLIIFFTVLNTGANKHIT